MWRGTRVIVGFEVRAVALTSLFTVLAACGSSDGGDSNAAGNGTAGHDASAAASGGAGGRGGSGAAGSGARAGSGGAVDDASTSDSSAGSGGAGANGGTSSGGASGNGGRAGAGGASGAGGVSAGGSGGQPGTGGATPDGSAPWIQDPAQCPPGVADGCCGPLTYGGTDPDCPAFDCTTPTLSTPILLPDGPTADQPKGGTAMLWTGRELVLARVDPDPVVVVNHPQSYILERRSETGQLLDSVRNPGCTFCANAEAVPAFTYEPASRRFFLAHPVAGTNGTMKVSTLDEHGVVGFSVQIGMTCNSEYVSHHAWVRNGQFLYTFGAFACSASAGRQITAATYDPDGRFSSLRNLNTWEGSTSFACKANCDELFVTYAEGSALRGLKWAPATNAITAGSNMGPNNYGGVYDHAVVFDGTNYFVVSIERPTSAGPRLFARHWTPAGAWLETSTGTAVSLRGFPPSLIWTGSGYVMAMAAFDSTFTPGFPDLDQIHIWIWNFAPDGQIRSSFQLETQGGVYPSLAWVNGRVAITWLREQAGMQRTNEQRYLAFLECR